jgi:hypothetical protein
MKVLISLGVAFFVIVLLWLAVVVFTPHGSSDAATGIMFMTFIGATVTTTVVLKYLRRPTAMIRRILISLGVGIVNLAFLYGVCFAPNPLIIKDAVIDTGLSAALVSLVTFAILSLPTPVPDRGRRVLISLSVAFFVAVFMSVQITSFLEDVKNLESIFSGLFIGTAVITSLVLSRWGRQR